LVEPLNLLGVHAISKDIRVASTKPREVRQIGAFLPCSIFLVAGLVHRLDKFIPISTDQLRVAHGRKKSGDQADEYPFHVVPSKRSGSSGRLLRGWGGFGVKPHIPGFKLLDLKGAAVAEVHRAACSSPSMTRVLIRSHAFGEAVLSRTAGDGTVDPQAKPQFWPSP
jgi:hypothetical protein